MNDRSQKFLASTKPLGSRFLGKASPKTDLLIQKNLNLARLDSHTKELQYAFFQGFWQMFISSQKAFDRSVIPA